MIDNNLYAKINHLVKTSGDKNIIESNMTNNELEVVLKSACSYEYFLLASYAVDALQKNGNYDASILAIIDQHHTNLNEKELREFFMLLHDDQTKMEYFQKYNQKYLFSKNTHSLIYCSIKNASVSQHFFKKHCDNFGKGEPLTKVIMHDYEHNFISQNKSMETYIPKLNTRGLISLIEKLCNQNDVGFIIEKLKMLFPRKDIEGLKRLYNAILLIDQDYFMKNCFQEALLLFEKDDQKIILMVLKNHPRLFSYFDFGMLKLEQIVNDQKTFQTLLYHPELCYELCDLYEEQLSKTNFLIKIIQLSILDHLTINYLFFPIVTELKERKYDSLFEKINMTSLTQLEYTNLVNYLVGEFGQRKMPTESWENIQMLEEEDIRYYQNNVKKNSDTKVYKASDIQQVKDSYFRTYFAQSLKEAKIFIKKYENSLWENKDQTDSILYIKKMIQMIQTEEIEQAKKIYIEEKKSYCIFEKVLFDGQLKTLFSDNILLAVNQTIQTEKSSTIIVSGKETKVYEPNHPFVAIVHCLNTYGAFDIHDNQYKKAWNNKSNKTDNQIFCSVITNQNVFATIDFEDVIFGFNHSPIIEMGPADYTTCSYSDVYHSEYQNYSSIQTLVNQTRPEGYNQAVLNGYETSKGQRIHPNHIVMYDCMTEVQKNHSILAASQFQIPLIYLDTKKIIRKEASILDKMIKQYKTNPNFFLLREIVIRHENNYHSMQWHGTKDLQQYFPSAKINDLLSVLIEHTGQQVIHGELSVEECIEILNSTLHMIENQAELSFECKPDLDIIEYKSKLKKVYQLIHLHKEIDLYNRKSYHSEELPDRKKHL